MTEEDAYNTVLQFLKVRDHGGFSTYGYEIYLPNLLRQYYQRQGMDEQQYYRQMETESTFIYSAAWEFCRRGIIRPGIKNFGGQATEEGSAGNGFSITEFGKRWLEEDNDSYVPTEPGRFAAMLEQYRVRLGEGFHQRAQEAIKCYGAHAYLSCCVMCGAASESILLKVAVETSTEDEILREYSGSSGRSRIENRVLNKLNDYNKREYQGFLSLLKYWRDNSAHGRTISISKNEAYTSLSILLRMSQFTGDYWERLCT